MIILGNNTTGVPDDIQIITEAAFPLGVNNGLLWYVSWNTAQGCCGGPYRNTGQAPNPTFPLTPAFTLSAPTSLISAAFPNSYPPTLTPPQLLEVTEITIQNPLTVTAGFGPISVFVVFFNGAPGGVSTTIMRFFIGGGQTVSYRATPGQNGVWKVFDGAANVVNNY